MINDNQNLESEKAEDGINTPNEVENDVESIVKVSIKTFYYCVVFLSFFITLFYTLFPFRALVFYTEFGMKEQAFSSAQKYVNINEKHFEASDPSYDSKYADALLACVNNSISLMASYKLKQGIEGAKTQYYAEMVVKYVDKYNSYPSLIQRTNMIDDYNLSNTLPSMRVFFYRFESDIARARAKALMYTGNSGQVFHEIMLATNSMDADDYAPASNTIYSMSNNFFIIADAIDYELEMLNYFSVQTRPSGLPDLNKLVEAQLPIKGNSFQFLYNKTPYTPHESDGNTYPPGATPLFKRITKHLIAYKDYIMNLTDGTNRDRRLEQLFYTKALTDMTMNFYRFMNLTYKGYGSIFNESNATILEENRIMNDTTYNFWDTNFWFSANSGSKNPIEYFNYMLQNYVSLFNIV